MTGRDHRLAVAVLVCLALTVGTSGLSTVSAERGFSVAVADDGSAYLGVQVHSHELPNGNHKDVPLLTLTNRFPSAIVEFDASVLPTPDPKPPRITGPGVERPPTPIGVGDTAAVTASLTCAANPHGTDQFTVHVTAVTASGSTVELERTVTIDCTGEPNRGASGRDRSKPDDDTRSNPGKAGQ